jgi:hypothetical protein
LTTVLLWPNHAYVTSLSALATELVIAIGPRILARYEGACIALFLKKVPNLLSQQSGTLWQGRRRKNKVMHLTTLAGEMDWAHIDTSYGDVKKARDN